MATGIVPAIGRPGVGSAVTAQRLNVSRAGELGFFPGGGVIDGTLTRDPGNSTGVRSLRPGLLMGLVTASGYYANSVIGVTTAAYTSGGTSLTVAAATVTELVRRVGESGTFNLIGPASAAGSNNTTQVTYSAASGTTITITNIGANRIAGCFIAPEDGSQVPVTFVPDGYNLLIDEDGNDISFPRIPVSGVLDVDSLIDWPTDTTLRAYVRTSLSTVSGGKFVFSDQFAP